MTASNLTPLAELSSDPIVLSNYIVRSAHSGEFASSINSIDPTFFAQHGVGSTPTSGCQNGRAVQPLAKSSLQAPESRPLFRGPSFLSGHSAGANPERPCS